MTENVRAADRLPKPVNFLRAIEITDQKEILPNLESSNTGWKHNDRAGPSQKKPDGRVAITAELPLDTQKMGGVRHPDQMEYTPPPDRCRKSLLTESFGGRCDPDHC